MKRTEASEMVFRIISYLLLTVFAVFCLYPFVYTVSASISGIDALRNGEVMLFPVDVQFDAFRYVIEQKEFWTCYANTLFMTFYGTIWALGVSVLGAYALSKKRLIFRKGFNFFLVFTMWFAAGVIPQWLNYKATQDVMHSVGILDDKWLVVIAMGMNAFNIILLRNAFESVPSEIERAAVVDGANEFQIMRHVYIPMSKSAIATVALFFGISRWNGYFWARKMIGNSTEWPLQVYIRHTLEQFNTTETQPFTEFSSDSVIYGMIICAIIPILIIYPYIQKYFAKGVNLGGVKE